MILIIPCSNKIKIIDINNSNIPIYPAFFFLLFLFIIIHFIAFVRNCNEKIKIYECPKKMNETFF